METIKNPFTTIAVSLISLTPNRKTQMFMSNTSKELTFPPLMVIFGKFKIVSTISSIALFHVFTQLQDLKAYSCHATQLKKFRVLK